MMRQDIDENPMDAQAILMRNRILYLKAEIEQAIVSRDEYIASHAHAELIDAENWLRQYDKWRHHG